MKIIFIRHGHPNYADDCLTEVGHKQAEAAADRLEREKIDKFYASSCGRAYETACHVAKRHNMEVEKLDFMREISWGQPDNKDDYVHPWWLVNDWVKGGKPIMNLDWQNDSDYTGRTVVNSFNFVSESFDKWLSGLGYEREGDYYRVTRENNDTILLASHGGSSSVVFSHIFNMPFSFVCHAICPGFTAITEVNISGEVGELTAPRFELVNDIGHIKNLAGENYYNN